MDCPLFGKLNLIVFPPSTLQSAGEGPLAAAQKIPPRPIFCHEDDLDLGQRKKEVERRTGRAAKGPKKKGGGRGVLRKKVSSFSLPLQNVPPQPLCSAEISSISYFPASRPPKTTTATGPPGGGKGRVPPLTSLTAKIPASQEENLPNGYSKAPHFYLANVA